MLFMPSLFWFYLFTALNIILLTLLAVNVSRVRMQERIPNGDGDNVAMKRAIRAHGNGVEHVGIFGLLILALCFTRSAPALLGTLVIGFTLARVAHAWGMLGGPFDARRLGAAATFLLELLGALALIINGVLV